MALSALRLHRFALIPLLFANVAWAQLRVTSAGVFYGHIWHFDEYALVVKPIEQGVAKTRFYLDRQTIYRHKKKKVKRADLKLGHKVAVRYFAENAQAIAEEVFMVEGEFNPRDYVKKKKALKTEEKKEGAESGTAPAAEAAGEKSGH